ncbi:unnamed protein product [Heterobilharzia americana]|nr:unnamed protein product [Heterobilharzia americana]
MILINFQCRFFKKKLFLLLFSIIIENRKFSGHGFILNKLTNRPITSTEERIEIEFQTEQSNSSLFFAGKNLFK